MAEMHALPDNIKKFKTFDDLLSEYAAYQDIFKAGQEELQTHETELVLKRHETAARKICLLDALHIAVKSLKCITLMLLGVANLQFSPGTTSQTTAESMRGRRNRRLNMTSEKIDWVLGYIQESVRDEHGRASGGRGLLSSEHTVSQFLLVDLCRVQGIIQRQLYQDKKAHTQPDGPVDMFKLVQRIERLTTKKAHQLDANLRSSTKQPDRSYGLSISEDSDSCAESIISDASAGNQHCHLFLGSQESYRSSRKSNPAEFTGKDEHDLEHYHSNYFLMTKYLVRAEQFWQRSIEIMNDACRSEACRSALVGSDSISAKNKKASESVQSNCSGSSKIHSSSIPHLLDSGVTLDKNAALRLNNGPHFYHRTHFETLKHLQSGTGVTGSTEQDRLAANLLRALGSNELRFHTCIGEAACLLHEKWQVFVTTVEGLI